MTTTRDDPFEPRLQHFILTDDNLVKPSTLEEWAVFFETPKRFLWKDQVGPFNVSTVFIGTPQGFDENGMPLLFETKVEAGEQAMLRRYAYYEDAKKGHREEGLQALHFLIDQEDEYEDWDRDEEGDEDE